LLPPGPDRRDSLMQAMERQRQEVLETEMRQRERFLAVSICDPDSAPLDQ
jgi:hypothetical protein